MKSKYKTLIPLTLAAALLFTGCGLAKSGSAGASGGLSAAAQTQTAVSAAAVADSEETAAAELFSKRDLSGDYDASQATAITLTGSSAKTDSDDVQISGSAVTITAAGTYILKGTLSDGSIIVDAGKEDKVQLVLDGVTIHSGTFAAIYVKQADKVFVTLAEGSVNTLSNGGAFTQIDDNHVDAVVFSKDDLTLNGSGSLEVSSPGGHGIVGKDEVTITGGTYRINAKNHAISGKDSIAIADGSFSLTACQDGLHAENDDDDTLGNITVTGGDFVIEVDDDAIHATYKLRIDGGSFDITAAEGLEATYVQINDGSINIRAGDDGINAGRKSSACVPTIEFNGGTTTIVMGAGDTDGVDSNGNIIVNGGTISVTGNSAFDYDGVAQYSGGTIVINGSVVNTIPNQMMGGGMGGGMHGGGMHGGKGGIRG
jgi:hypothetical protein